MAGVRGVHPAEGGSAGRPLRPPWGAGEASAEGPSRFYAWDVDAAVWVEEDFAPPPGSVGAYDHQGEDRYVAVGDAFYAWTEDTPAWEVVQGGAPGELTGLHLTYGTYAAVGKNVYLYDEAAAAWSARAISTPHPIGGMQFITAGLYVAAGTGVYHWNESAIAWEEEHPGLPGTPRGLQHNGYGVAVGVDRQLWEVVGSGLEPYLDPAPAELRGYVHNTHGIFVAVAG